MFGEKISLTIIPALWAGLALGGNLIAAPAKFQVDALSTADLLMVGRAQFAWIGGAEYVLAALVLGAVLARRNWSEWPLLVVLCVFMFQQIGLQPMLQMRSDMVMSGLAPGASQVHLLFIAAEVTKVVLLLWSAVKSGPQTS